jgi:hypothetical protein
MALVGEAEVVVVANTEEFDAKMETLGAEGDLAGLGGGATVAGEDAGKDITTGVESETSKLEPALAEDGALAGVGLRTGVTDETGKLADDVGDDAEEAGARLEKGVGDHVSKLKGMLSGLGIPESLLSGPAVAAEALGGLSLEAFHLQNEMQKATVAIENTEGISVKAADQIGTAFLHMGGEFNGKEIAQAFGAVAGQLKAIDGQALTTKQSVAFMAQATQLATAANVGLGDATGDVAGILQAYTLNSKDAGDVSNYLFNTANATGIGLDGVTNALTKLKSGLGGMAPPLKDTAGLLLDLTNHGETGRKAVSALSSGFTAFVKPITDQITAQKNYKIALDQLPPSLRGIAEASIHNAGAATQLYNMTEKMSQANQSAVSNFQSAAEAMTTSKDAADKLGFSITGANGQLLPMNEIIGKLHTQIDGMKTAQATATLSADGFGSSAARWVKTVQAGPEAFDKATAAVAKHDAVQKAAEANAKTFDVAIKTLLADVEDVTIEFGQELAPVFKDVLGIAEEAAPYIKDVLGVAFKILGDAIGKTTEVIKDSVDWFKKNKDIAILAAGILTAVLAPAFKALAKDAAGAFGDMISSGEKWVQKTATQVKNILTGNFSVRASNKETAASAETAADASTAAAGQTEEANASLVTSSSETTAALTADGEEQQLSFEGVAAAAETTEGVIVDTAPEVEAAEGGMTGGITLLIGAAILLATHWKEVWKIVRDVALDAYHFIDNDVVHPIERVFDEVVGFIKSHWELLVGIIGGPLIAAGLLIYHFRDDILKTFKDIIGDMKNIGEDIVKGLIEGLKDGVHLAESAAKDVGHAVEDGIKDVLHIFSPSQVMHEIGGNVAQGLADGIRDKSNVAEREARAMASRVRDAAKGGLGGSTSGGSGAMVQLTLAKGAIEIHAVNTDEKKTLDVVEKALEDAFRRLNAELSAGISQLSAKASA